MMAREAVLCDLLDELPTSKVICNHKTAGVPVRDKCFMAYYMWQAGEIIYTVKADGHEETTFASFTEALRAYNAITL